MTSLLSRIVAFGAMNQSPVSYAPSRASGIKLPWTGQKNDALRQMQAYGSVGTLFACTNLVATAVAGTEWKLYRSSDGRGKIAGEENRREVTSHLALDIWNKPNSFYTRQQFVHAVQQHKELTGEGVWTIARDKRAPMPLELWPVRPDRVTPIPHPTKFIAGYEISDADGGKIPFLLNEVTRLITPNPLDPYRGMGPVQSMMAELDAAKYGAEWNRNFFLNSAEPGGVIEVDGRLSDPEFDEVVSRWNEQHRGASRAHRIAFLEAGTFKSNAFSQRDMQFAELRNVSRDAIMEVFRIHKGMLGITENVNKANAAAGENHFSKWVVVPRLEEWKSALNNQFLPMFGDTGSGYEFDYESPIETTAEDENQDRDSKVAALVALVNAGFDVDSVCEAIGLPPMKYTKPVAPAPMPVGGNNGSANAQDIAPAG